MERNNLTGHLAELRNRLIKALIFCVVLFVLMFPFADNIYVLFSHPLIKSLPESSDLIATGVGSPFIVPIKLVLSISILISTPYIVYQLWLFAKPGLLNNEKEIMLPFAISSFFLFYLGALFAFFIVVPILINFFISAAPESVKIMTDISEFFNFTIKIIIGFGIAFQIPIFTIISVRLGLFSKEKLRKSRPYLIILFFTIGMFLTPPDILSQIFLALPMWFLFEIGLLVSKEKD
tara:strand:+ start:49 stop:753 length:705 start_codon:yes stop_codon:yes gene_type:complete